VKIWDGRDETGQDWTAWSVFTEQFQRQEILLASYPHSTLDLSLSLSLSVYSS